MHMMHDAHRWKIVIGEKKTHEKITFSFFPFFFLSFFPNFPSILDCFCLFLSIRLGISISYRSNISSFIWSNFQKIHKMDCTCGKVYLLLDHGDEELFRVCKNSRIKNANRRNGKPRPIVLFRISQQAPLGLHHGGKPHLYPSKIRPHSLTQLALEFSNFSVPRSTEFYHNPIQEEYYS
jgi:hypothetical protein